MSVYGSRPTNSRGRRSRAQLDDLDAAIIEAVDAEAPLTLRGVYYKVVAVGAVDKTEAAYKAVQRRLAVLRQQRRVSYDDVVDGTRLLHQPNSWDSVDEAIDTIASVYRRSLWTTSPYQLMLFVEKDAISGIVLPIAMHWDVPLGVLRGFASDSFCWRVAKQIDPSRINVLAQLGDHDPSGVAIWRDFVNKVCDLAFEYHEVDVLEVIDTRLAVTPEQIEEYDLLTRPTKTSDSRSKTWHGGDSVDVDAMPSSVLRALVQDFAESHVDPHQLSVLRAAEESERDGLRSLMGRLAA